MYSSRPCYDNKKGGMEMMKKSAAVILVIILIITALPACSDTGTDSSNKVQQAYSEVLSQYEKAAAMPWEEYMQQKADFPLVNERAIRNYPGGDYLLYACYDLNNDGTDELLIATDYDIPDQDTPLRGIDVFTCINGQPYSVLADKIGENVEKQILYDLQIHKTGVITVDVRTGYYEEINVDGILSPCWHKTETWFYRLDENGESLETIDHLLKEDGKYYYEEKEIDADEYMGIREEKYFDRNDTYDIPYKSLIDGSDAKDVQTSEAGSEIYTKEDISSAISVINKEFDRNWKGCTMKKIAYAGDETTEEESQYKKRSGMAADDDQVIVLVSTFDVDESGGDGSLEPNSTYKDWKWILIRHPGGMWEHVDHGY